MKSDGQSCRKPERKTDEKEREKEKEYEWRAKNKYSFAQKNISYVKYRQKKIRKAAITHAVNYVLLQCASRTNIFQENKHFYIYQFCCELQVFCIETLSTIQYKSIVLCALLIRSHDEIDIIILTTS